LGLQSILQPWARDIRRFSGTKRPLTFCPVTQKGASVMLTTSSTKRTRNRVDISSKELSRYWCKRLKKSKPEIEAAIAKVGDNAETVMKELGANRLVVAATVS
jgi:hypothetical protein